MYQSHSSLPSKIAAQKHEIAAQNKVAEKSHFFPVLMTIYIAIPIAGISTNPANAYRKTKNNDKIIYMVAYVTGVKKQNNNPCNSFYKF